MGGIVYLAAACLLLAGVTLFVRRDVRRLRERMERADVAQ